MRGQSNNTVGKVLALHAADLSSIYDPLSPPRARASDP